METLFFIFLGIMVIGFIGSIFNVIISILNDSEASTMLIGHFVMMLFYIVGVIGSIVTGTIWIVQQLS